MLELRILNGAQALPLFDLPSLLGRKRAAQEVGDQIETLIAFMDSLGGDPDLEDTNDAEGEDERDVAWPEFDPARARRSKGALGLPDTSRSEDDEEDDAPGGNITDEPHDPEEDMGAEENGEGGSWAEDQLQYGTCIAYNDDDRDADSEPRYYQHERDRVRRTRCDRTTNPYAPYRVKSRKLQMVVGA